MKIVTFTVPDNQDLKTLMEVIKKFGITPKIQEAKEKQLKVIDISNSVTKRKLTSKQIDRLIFEYRHGS